MVSLSEVTTYFTIYGFFITLIFGTVGGVFNIITFLSQDFRGKACVFYLICSSSLDLLFINFGIIIRFSTEYFGNNLILVNRGVCKIRAYFLVCLPLMASSCVLLAAFDRFISTSLNARWRQMSSIPCARRFFTVTMIIVIGSSSFHLFIFDIRNGTCTALPGLQTIISTLYSNIFCTIIPYTGMMIFSIMTWFHIRKSKNRIAPILYSNSQIHYTRRINRQLFVLVFIHAFISTILSTQRGITYSYNYITSSVQKSVEQQKIEYLIQQVSTMLFYINYGLPFYIYYGSSTIFRKTYKKSMKHLWNKCLSCCKCS